MPQNYCPKVIGLDYGTKRIGVAVSYGTLAEPLLVINNSGSEKTANQVVQDAALHEIIAICTTEQAAEVVVGVSENRMGEQSARFAQILQQHLSIPVLLHDETLTSAQAEQKLREAQVPKRKRAGKIDHYSAALILEEWLELKCG